MEKLMNELVYVLKDCATLSARLQIMDDVYDNVYIELGDAYADVEQASQRIVQLLRKYINKDIKEVK
jgi:hypothetical protein